MDINLWDQIGDKMPRTKKKTEDVVEIENVIDNNENIVVGIICDPVDPDQKNDEPLEIVLNEEQKKIQEKLALQHVINERRMAYPSLLEQVQALWYLQQGDDSEFKRINDIINEVKVKYPKPETNKESKEGEI